LKGFLCESSAGAVGLSLEFKGRWKDVKEGEWGDIVKTDE
jgi:hypothetical protein